MVSGRAGVERLVLDGGVVLGMSPDPIDLDERDLADLDVLVTSSAAPPRPWVVADPDAVRTAVAASPDAAAVLAQVLRLTERLAVLDGLAVESMAYSVLQHGEAFQRWRRDHDLRAPRTVDGDVVELDRRGDRLDVVLNRPEVHNAMDTSMRDGLVEAFELVAADPSIRDVHLIGRGPSFCAGGDLDEFGSAADAVAAHRLRLERSVGRRVHGHRQKVTAHLHGHAIGAGIEVPAFAGRVLAAPDTVVRLPELALGLIPGAGGTVSLPRRIGRHRTAYLALTGEPLDAATAHRWGLVDALEDSPNPPH